MTNELKQQIEHARDNWSKVAKENGWYKYPFYIQVWHDGTRLLDAVSHKDMTKDIIILDEDYDQDWD